MTRRERARDAAGGKPLVTADPFTVTWLTGLVADIEIGPSPFTAPPLAVLFPDGGLVVVVSEDEAEGAAAGVETRTFPGFAVEDVDRPAAAVREALEVLGGARELAAEVASLPGTLVRALGDARLQDVAPALRAARAVKDADEVEALRASVAIADAGQAAARAALAVGASELALWEATRAAMEERAGSRLPVLADLVTGERTADVGGPPGTRAVGDGDLLLVDLVPRVGAYWADSCATVAVGEPSAEARRAHDAARAALERVVSMCRAGARAADIDGAAREGLGYPHHTGHGIGVSFHEEPRVIPDTDRVLEPGMVVALEPGAYGDAWGVRVEQVVLVTEGAPEVLSGHDLAL